LLWKKLKKKKKKLQLVDENITYDRLVLSGEGCCPWRDDLYNQSQSIAVCWHECKLNLLTERRRNI
jgi:hypothetical protein